MARRHPSNPHSLWLHLLLASVRILLPEAGFAQDVTPEPSRETGRAREEPTIFGPIPLRSLAGLSLIFYQPAPERAATLPKGAWRLATNFNYASIEDDGENDEASVFLDGEILGWEVRADYGITDRLELSITIPTYYTTGGFLDRTIDEFHDLTGLSRSSSRDANQWTHEIAVGDETIFDPDDDRFGLADIPVQLKYAILTEHAYPLGLSVRAGLELPTGRESEDFGSGGLDLGLGVILEKSFDHLGFFSSFDYLVYERPSDFRSAGASLEDFIFAASWGAEWRPMDFWAIHAQFDVLGNYIRGTSLSKLEDAQLIPSLGLSFAVTDSLRLRLAASEDMSHAATADIAFFLGLSWQAP